MCGGIAFCAAQIRNEDRTANTNANAGLAAQITPGYLAQGLVLRRLRKLSGSLK